MPLTVATMNDSPIVVAGVRAILEPYQDRVRVIEIALTRPVATEVHVILYDTFGCPYGPRDDPRAELGLVDAKLVAFTWDLDPEGVRAALGRGIDGFIWKRASGEELVSAIERSSVGERVLPSDMPASDPGVLLGQWPGQEHGLSVRESQIVAQVCQGLSNAEISERMYISINTIKTYIGSV